MREHAQKQSRPQHDAPAPDPARLARLTRAGQAVQLYARPGGAGRQSETVAPAAARAGLDFSRTPARSAAPAVREAARLGTSGAPRPLPHLDAIQRSFGHHDVSGVAAHVGPPATAGARLMGAEAFTLGGHVAFAQWPTLRTAAHEAAHVLQQRAGVRLAGGVGAAGDRYERHADEVAERVAAGQSSEGLLDAFARPGGPAEGAVQMKRVPTAYGEFEDVHYSELRGTNDEAIGCAMYLRFTPNEKVDATKIGLTQVIKPTREGVLDAQDETKKKHAVTEGVGKDFYVDQTATIPNPLFATDPEKRPATDADKMEAWETSGAVTEMSEKDRQLAANVGYKGVRYGSGTGQHGHRKMLGTMWDVKPAELSDWPHRPLSVGKKNSGQYIETTALAIEGPQKGTYYGSVKWGWERDAAAAFKLIDFERVTSGTPSANFRAAAAQWNISKTRTREETIDLPLGTPVYTTNVAVEASAGAAKLNLPAQTRVRVIGKGAAAADPWTVEIVDGEHIGKQVSVDGATLVAE